MAHPAYAALSFQRALDFHHGQLMNLEPTEDQSIKLFHLLVSALEWCDRQTPVVDFDLTPEEVREYFAAEASQS